MSASFAPVTRVGDVLDVAVGQDRNLLLHAHRPGETDRGAGHLLDHLGRGQFELRGLAGAANLAFVGLVIAADQDGDRLAVGHVDQRLDQLVAACTSETR